MGRLDGLRAASPSTGTTSAASTCRSQANPDPAGHDQVTTHIAGWAHSLFLFHRLDVDDMRAQPRNVTRRAMTTTARSLCLAGTMRYSNAPAVRAGETRPSAQARPACRPGPVAARTGAVFITEYRPDPDPIFTRHRQSELWPTDGIAAAISHRPNPPMMSRECDLHRHLSAGTRSTPAADRRG